MSLRRPVKVGKYDVIDVIGRGGMGVVYKATDPALGRSVAIKMMTMEDYSNNPEMLQRFYREAKSTGNLHHRNIVTVYELGDQDGSPYLVMEFLEGQSLDSFLRSRRSLTLLERIDFIVEICEGLTYAHDREVIHRDIKPGNIMVLANGGVKIVDFGIAHIGNRTVTRTGQLLGSLPYMSPEQISGNQVDGRSDIFSLGVVFYQLLTFELPFEGDTPAATLLEIMHDPPRPLADFNDSYPAELDDILLRVLAKNRDQRYSTAQEFAFDLLQVRARIQRELVEEHLNEAESFLLQGELLKTRDKLSHVLKIDRYNTKAVELSRITQQHLERQEMGQRVGELRRQAEEAYRQDQFVVALDLIQQALSLHSTDPDLQRLRVNVQQARARAERLQRTIERAELAFQQGELDSARQAIEEALALGPDDRQVKQLHENIQRDWTQRARRLRVESLIEEARKEIASRNFTLALKVLHDAEAIDPAAPQLKALIEAAQAAREQEQRRKAMETMRHEIEAALDRDDFEVACSKAQIALHEFPDDRGLEKLAELAEKQRSLAERKQFIDQQVSHARKLLEVGGTEEALQILQSAQESIGGDPHVESLLGVVRETLEQQRIEARKTDYLRRARDLLRRKDYAECIRTLKEAQSDLGRKAEIDDLLQFAIDQSNAEKRRLVVDAAAEKARTLIEAQDYEGAVRVLEDAHREVPDEELRLGLVQARHAASDHKKRLQDALANAESMMRGQRPIEALKYLRSQPGSFSRDPQFLALVATAEQEVERQMNVERELEKARVHARRDEYDQARAVVTEGTRLYGPLPEFIKLLSEIEELQAQFAAETLQAAMNQARSLMLAGSPDAALDHLAHVETKIATVPAKLSAEFSALQLEAGNAKVRKSKASVEQLLAEGEHEKATAVLEAILREFPHSRELQQLKKSLDQATQRRSDAQNQISRAKASFDRGSWREGAERCLHAVPFAARDPMIRTALVAALEHAAADCAETNWREAEYLLECMKSVQPSAVFPSETIHRIEKSKQEESFLELLAEVHELEAQGDLEAALRRVQVGLASHPADRRLSDLKQHFEELQSNARERRRGEREKQAYIEDVEQRLKLETRSDGRIRILEEALRAYPEEADFTRELSVQQTLWKTVTSLVEEANRHERSKRYEQAIQSWQSIRELEVTHPDLETSLTRLNLSKREFEREIQRAKEAREKQEQLADILESAQVLRSHGNLETSLRKIEEGLSIFPAHPQFVQMKAAVEDALRKAQLHKDQTEPPQPVALPVENRAGRDEKRNPSAAEQRKGKPRKDQSPKKAETGSQQGEQEIESRPPLRPTGEPDPIGPSSARPPAQEDKDSSTSVWQVSPLPANLPEHRELRKQIHVVSPASSKAKKGAQGAKPNSAAKTKKLTAAIAACILAAALFGSVAWKGTHKAEVPMSSPVETASPPLAPSGEAPLPTPAPRVGLEVREAKPGTDVLVDHRPQGKTNRNGAFSIDLTAGDHQIQWTARNKLSGTVVRQFVVDRPVRLTAADLVPAKPVVPGTVPSADEAAWQTVKESQAPLEIEQFIVRYPNSGFLSEAQRRLESLDWKAASERNSISAYNLYIEKDPQGAHAQQARDTITELEWRSVENSGDITALDAFLRKHPSGTYHDQAVNKLDETAWQKTKPNDVASLRSYLQGFSEGHHAGDARRRIVELASAVAEPPVIKSAPRTLPPRDENKAVLEVLGRYRQAYEGHELGQLREIWPTMSPQQVRSLGDFFAHASELSLEYQVLGTPSVDAEHATVTFQQSLHYVVNGKPGKDLATVTMRLNKSVGNSAAWRIDSVR